MRSWWLILALMPMLILGVSGICRSGECETTAQACEAVDLEIPSTEPDSCCSGIATEEEPEVAIQDRCAMNAADAMANCCCQVPVPLSDLIFCCLTPLSSVPPTPPDVLIKPSISAFVLPAWEDSPRIFAQRHLQTPPVIAKTGPPPSRPSLCIWVI